MLGEGMPWMFLLPMAMFGILWGINAGKRAENLYQTEKKQENENTTSL